MVSKVTLIGLLGILISSAWALDTLATDMTFKSHGKVIKALSAEAMAQLAPLHNITVWDANEEKEIQFSAYSASQVLDKIYGKDWQKQDEVLFTCLDGYQPSIPVSRFREFKGFFAVSRSGSSDFTITVKSENNKKVNVSPFYLIWDNLEYPEIKIGDGASWPYQVVTVDLVNFAEIFPRLAPPASASASAKRGFIAFRKNCMACHTLNGDGGNGGPELNYPVNITQYYKESFLKKWISDPKSIRFKTAMPGLNPLLKGRDAIIKDIIAYFKAMEKSKKAPKAP